MTVKKKYKKLLEEDRIDPRLTPALSKLFLEPASSAALGTPSVRYRKRSKRK